MEFMSLLISTIDVNIKTNASLTNTVTVIIYATYSTDLSIDKDNNVELGPL